MKTHARARERAQVKKSAAAKPRAGAQVTIRGVAPHVERGLRKKARGEGRSLNAVMVEALSREFDEPGAVVHRDLDALAGAWVEDPAFDAALAEQDRVDESLWR